MRPTWLNGLNVARWLLCRTISWLLHENLSSGLAKKKNEKKNRWDQRNSHAVLGISLSAYGCKLHTQGQDNWRSMLFFLGPWGSSSLSSFYPFLFVVVTDSSTYSEADGSVASAIIVAHTMAAISMVIGGESGDACTYRDIDHSRWQHMWPWHISRDRRQKQGSSTWILGRFLFSL